MSNKVEATFHPNQPPATLEARKLTGEDLGRTVTATDLSGAVITGELEAFNQSRTQTRLRLLTHKMPVDVRTYPRDPITISGKEAA